MLTTLKTYTLQEAIKQLDGAMGEDPFPLIHHFATGVYAREIFIPKGHVVVGKKHKHDHLLIFLSGDITVVTDDHKQRYVGPHVEISPKGAKRAFYSHEDSRILTIHPTKQTDLDIIESETVYSEAEEKLEGGSMKVVEKQ